MTTKTQARAVTRLFAGFDAERHGLPSELIDARARLHRMDAAVNALTRPDAEQTARASAVRDALADPSADVAGPVLAARADDEAATLRAQVLRDARAVALAELTSAVYDLAETVFTDHLRPALHDALERAKAAHKVYKPHGSDERQLFQSHPKVRTAWSTFAAAADAYQALCTARDVLLDLTGRALQDDRGLFAMIKNTEEVWPEIASSQLPVSMLVRPWPAGGGREFLAWALEHGAELWLPTGEEQDARWLELYGARVAEHQLSNHLAGQYRALVV